MPALPPPVRNLAGRRPPLNRSPLRNSRRPELAEPEPSRNRGARRAEASPPDELAIREAAEREALARLAEAERRSDAERGLIFRRRGGAETEAPRGGTSSGCSARPRSGSSARRREPEERAGAPPEASRRRDRGASACRGGAPGRGARRCSPS